MSTRIAIIGAGGIEFPLRLMNDFLSFPALADAEYVLMDIDPVPLERTARLSQRIADAHGLPARILSTTSLREALTGTRFVVTCFQVGGRTAYRHDIEIPLRYGVDQTVGDTLGPGGVMRGLRTMRALDEICEAMRDLCPDALLLNYTNPMSINCAFTSGQGVETVGLCHSVAHTAQEIADIVGYEPGAWSFRAAGINHQAWILEYRHNGVDVLPEVRRALTAYGRGEKDPARPIDEWYAGNREAVRLAVMELTGYFQTESSHHASEYYPHFRRTAEDRDRVLPQPWRYLEVSSATTEEDLEQLAADSASGELETTEEYAARIVDSIVTDTPRTVYGNVPNSGLITNLPPGSCVEVPVLVDASGVQPTFVGDLPVACAAVNQASVGLQALTVEAYRTRSRDLVHAAIAMDRLTGSLLSLGQIRSMTDELLEAERTWLPELR